MIQWVEKSDVGRVRTLNEDCSAVQAFQEGGILAVVADGMGGHQAGEVASQMAVEAVMRQMKSESINRDSEQWEQQIVRAIYQANEEIYQLAADNNRYSGMGTTIIAALAFDDEIVIAHIGDSRAYLSNNQTFTQLTEDHSLVNELLKQGQINANEAKDHPRRNVLMRALGTELHVKVDTSRHPWGDGDLLLLCSDGLSSLVDDDQIQEVINRDTDLDSKAQELVSIAMQAGGDDNITVVLLQNVQTEVRGNEVNA